MLLGDVVAVAEHFCDERCGDFFDETPQGCVACAEEVYADFSETHHEGVGVYVLPGAVAREEPRTAGAAAGTHVGA